jgi:5'-3' exonuclease
MRRPCPVDSVSPVTERPEKLLLLDTASLYFRAFFGVPDSIRAPDGTPVNAVRGLMDFVSRLVTDRQPTRLVACLDHDWRPAWRVELLPTYKAHRVVETVVAADGEAQEEPEDTPDDLEVQVPIILDVLHAFGLTTLGADGYEADDVIGSLTAQSACPVDVVTGDRDLFQLVDDGLARRVLYTARGVGRHDVVDEAWVAAKYAIPGKAYAAFATLRGDSSDGLPGVKGVGDKTAAFLTTRYGTVDAIVAAAQDAGSDMAAPVRKKILDGLDYLAVAPRVVAVATDIDVPTDPDFGRLPRTWDDARVADLTERWGLGSATGRLEEALGAARS